MADRWVIVKVKAVYYDWSLLTGAPIRTKMGQDKRNRHNIELLLALYAYDSVFVPCMEYVKSCTNVCNVERHFS